jgi:hypothetical protein
MTTQAQRRWLREARDRAPVGILPVGITGGLRHYVVIRMLDRMVSRGWLTRRPGGPYTITDAGTAELDKIAKRGRRSREVAGR